MSANGADARVTGGAAGASARSTHSQTLSRGIQALELLGAASTPLTIAEVADGLGLHRSVVYRILRTLEDHGLVSRDASGRLRLGPGIAALARGVSRGLQEIAQPEMSRIAERFGVTAFVGVLDRLEVVTLLSVEPRDAHASIAQRPGTRHDVNRGSTGYAVLAGMRDDAVAVITGAGLAVDEARLAETRTRGYATSRDEVIPGLRSIAVPLPVASEPNPLALSIVSIAELDDPELVADSLTAAA
ncbi:MAG: IclR family transcriptional regulator, partial [Pseudoclavibacter sp.]